MSRAAAAFAAAALLSNAPAEAHESHRHRAAIPSRSGIAAADEAQLRHDFAAARSELDRLLAADPRDLEARLMSANLRLLAGEFDGARADCQRVLETGALYVGTICLASTQTGRNSVQRGRAMIAALGDHGEAANELQVWRLLTEADLASRAGDDDAARALLERAHALDPAHEEALTQLASQLLDAGEPQRALVLASAPGASPSRLVVRLRAAIALGDPRAAKWHHELDEVLAADRRRGIPPHLREEAELALYVDGDYAAALALARQNFATQRDTRDLRLLAAAAKAQGDRAAIAELRGWMAETGFEDRVALTVP